MPEQRGRAYDRARIGETLKEEIGVIIEGELGDPRIALCTVTEIAPAKFAWQMETDYFRLADQPAK
jgi:ribosome-binding factor A